MKCSSDQQKGFAYSIWPVVALVLVVALLMGFGFVFNQIEQLQLTQRFIKNVGNASSHFNDDLQEQEGTLTAVLRTLENDQRLVDALAAADRDQLLTLTAPLFETLRTNHAVTHLYFSDPRRVNLLRVHHPQRYGDTIKRRSSQMAERNRALSAGLEMGPLGTLTLRVVAPWYQGDRLIGYVELGTEVEHLIDNISQLFDLQAVVRLDKSRLERDKWEEGMHMMEREADWAEAPEYVLSYATQWQLGRQLPTEWDGQQVDVGGNRYHVRTLPVGGIDGDEVAQIVLFSRFDSEALYLGSGGIYAHELYVAMGVGVALIVLLTIYFSRRALTRSKRALERIKREWADVFDAVGEPIFLHDQQLRLIHANRAYLKLAGMCEQEVIGKRYWEAFPRREGGLPGCNSSAKGCLGHPGDVVEEEFELPDGRLFNSRAYLITDDAGVYQYSIHMLQDITEKRDSQKQLQLSRVAFENAAEGIMITDGRSNILTVNHGFTEMTGYSIDEVLGKKPSLLQSGRHDPHFYAEMWSELHSSGHWQGEVWNRRKSGEVYPQWLTIDTVKDGSGTLTHYVAIFADLTDLKSSQDALDHLTYHDALTGLPNRALLKDRLEHGLAYARRNDSRLALLVLNPQRIKMINESLGHTVGDAVLCAIAQRLKRTLYHPDATSNADNDMVMSHTLARLAGDEFAIVLENINEPEDAGRMAQRLLKAIARPLAMGQHRVVTTASIGISIYPTDAGDVESMIQCADTAAHRAKLESGSASCFYSADMAAIAAQRLSLEADIQRGLEQGEFSVHYQPQYTITDDRLTGAEVLVRWEHPQRGRVLPGEFIPLAEESGLIVQLGKQVLLEACRQAAIWYKRGHLLPVAVNLSVRQFRHANLVSDIQQALTTSGLPAELLELEITETSIMESGDEALIILDQIKAIGVSLAMDDFGTGYSSLANLKRFPIDKLKIDRAFVRDLPDDVNDAAISRAIISLAKSMQLRVLAEGVETEDQLAFLQREGCDEMQGYLRGRPMPAEQLDELLQREEDTGQCSIA